MPGEHPSVVDLCPSLQLQRTCWLQLLQAALLWMHEEESLSDLTALHRDGWTVAPSLSAAALCELKALEMIQTLVICVDLKLC